MKQIIYITKNKVWIGSSAFAWNGNELVDIFEANRDKLNANDIRIVLGNDVSYLCSFSAKEIENLDRESIRVKTQSFFPIEISPLPYNATVAQDFMPVSEEEAKQNNFRWENQATRSYNVTIKNNNIPGSLLEIDDSIYNEILECKHAEEDRPFCTKAYKIVSQELIFYRRFNLSLPDECPNCRHYARVLKRQPLKLWHRQCMCDKKHTHHEGTCPNEFETSYAPDRPEMVYCESCYQQEVYA